MEFARQHPLYLQISDYICENILLRVWKENEKIPSKTELAVSVEVNPNTVMRAYSHLQDRGIIYVKRGIGYFVTEDSLNKTRQLKKDDFTKYDLPMVFRTMWLLQLSPDDLKPHFKDYVSKLESKERT